MSSVSSTGSLPNLSSVGSTSANSSSSTPSNGAANGSLIQAAVGPVSGINYGNLIQALTANQQQQVSNIQNNISALQAKQTGYQTLEANLAPLTTAAQTLGLASTFQTFQVQLSDPNQLSVTASNNAAPGTYQFQSLQLASSQVSLSQGFANATTQTLGTGTLTISGGGGLSTQTTLSDLNGGQGVQRGDIRITDAAGHTAVIDLSTAYTVNDVLNAINNNGVADVTAATNGGQLILKDTSGGSGSLTVSDVNGDKTADNLGITGTSATGTITGTNVYHASANTALSQINDGNGLYTISGVPALSITLSDGTNLQVDLSSAATVGDVVNDINNATGNSGKLTASVSNGALKLTDNSGGAGTLSVADTNGSAVVQALGLNTAASGNTITGTPLLAGINSVLLRNLNGGQGITQIGQIQLQDRTGLTATINLTGATSLDQVINTINNATTTGGQKLHLSAQVDSAGDGISVSDTSGSTANNLVIMDAGTGTLATQLNIATNSATSSVDSGRLNLQYVNEGSSLSTYAPGGGAVPQGAFTITDSAGHQATINVTSSTKTVGDVIQLINSASGIQVHAQLNSTGDGFVVTDQAGGTGSLSITDDGGNTAADLRIAGTGTPNGGGQSQIDSREATIINVTSSDTLNSIVQKIGQSGLVNASVVNDGSANTPNHLELAATTSGQAGQFFIDQSGINLGFQTSTPAQNALLLVGSGAAGLILSSSTNTFNNAQPGLTVQTLGVGSAPDSATVTQNTSSIVNDVQTFVTNYNNFITQVQSLTAFNTTTDTGAALEGSPTVTFAETQLSSLITQPILPSGNTVQTFGDLGISVGPTGSLTLDQNQLQSVLTSNPQEVSNFFTTASTGFAAVVQSTLKSITDPTTGSFTLANNALQDSINSYQNQITTLNQILTNQQQQLAQSFANLEAFIAQMQSQQQEVSQLSLIAGSSSGSSSSSSSSSSGSSVA